MKIRFWGVRGSIPTPLSPDEVRRKISSVLAQVGPQDIRDNKSRELFLSKLPASLFGTVGGNTTCLEVRLEDGRVILFDAGTGLSRFAASAAKELSHPKEFHLFFTHFHWDHIQGFPFFTPQAFDGKCKIHVYSPREDVERILREQMKPPYFPITMDTMQAKIEFHHLSASPLRLGGAEISWRGVKHPGASFSYKVKDRSGAFIFSTDTELSPEDFARSPENQSFYERADVLVMDSQYTLDEAIEKYDWGHSSYSLAVDFASEWKIKKLVLFHHEPLYNDNKMAAIEKSARWYKSHINQDQLDITIAREGLELVI
ncbi:MAG TPA: MBL fold metallo-hydrolase [Sediminispirochaeta sp.]|nr:MBL fold metallo-hydrolase [Sediminispirochaeta sp.]